MTAPRPQAKPVTVNPLAVSPALGGALAFLGVDRCLPLFHGAQGCTAFALVLAVRHFREAIPLQTTAMSELSTILGGADNVEQAIGNIYERARPRLIGICSTALTETRDEDIAGDLKRIVPEHPEWADLAVVSASTPDDAGGLEEGWAAAVAAMIDALVEPAHRRRTLRQVNLLPGSHLTPGDVDALREVIETFGLRAVVLPDLSGSLDGHVPAGYTATSLGGTAVDEIAGMGESVLTLAVGEQMRGPAERLEARTGVPTRLLRRVTGLEAVDALVAILMEVSGSEPPPRLRRERSRLIDAMLDGHFFFGGRTVAVAGDSDEVFTRASLLAEMGASVGLAVATARRPVLAEVPAAEVIVGDFDDLETRMRAIGGFDLIMASSNARQAAERLGVAHIRCGFPVFDRLGAAQKVTAGYRGSRDLIFEIGNVLLAAGHDATAGHSVPPAAGAPAATHRNEGNRHENQRSVPAAAD